MTSEINLLVPVLPESIEDATVVSWHKKPGESVKRDENLVDLETDKVVLEVPAPSDGVLKQILKSEGETVLPEQILGTFVSGGASSVSAPAKTSKKSEKASSQSTGPAARRLLAENDMSPEDVKGSGKAGRITKSDVASQIKSPSKTATVSAKPQGAREEQRVPMTRLRQRIAERLLDAQHNTAMLTTFNEVDMKAVMDLRKKYKDQFEKTHNARLGFMSFFTKAAIEALKRFPSVNASIDGDDIVYHNYFDIGMAISTPRGLVVPVVRDADQLGMSDIESSIVDFANRAREGKLSLEEMTGGTFSITNGGVFGSLLSTPILNSPQSAILGMHKIQEKPVVINGEIVIRPMMYLALSYDHRIVDGKEAISFLVTIKEMLEDPARLLLNV
jgi:2-oxoglutarate dehydrogenase E2 component (dihydrolipoamide succinyltransferase)